jgi:hypothetical protein
MMFVNLTKIGTPKIIDIIPDIINQDPPKEVKEELEKRSINYAAFKIPDACPTDGAIQIQILKNEKLTPKKGIAEMEKLYKKAEKRANARCYAFVSSH